MDDNPAAIGPLTLPPLVRLRFRLRAINPICLPEYPGSAWRGLLGHGLRRTACVTQARHCEGCLLLDHCVYTSLFETHAPPGPRTARFTAPPRPYVLHLAATASREIGAGEKLETGIILIGASTQQLPYLIQAMRHAGDRGIGRNRGRFTLEAVDQDPELGSDRWLNLYDATDGRCQAFQASIVPIPPAPASAVRVTLITPLRIKRRGHFLGADDFSATDFLFNLCSRLRLLAEHHGGDPTPLEWARLHTGAGRIALREQNLRWHDWTRWSSRQDTLMQMGGLLGSFVFAGPDLPTFWPALWYGQWLHAGKGTTFGLGHYRLEATKSDP